MEQILNEQVLSSNAGAGNTTKNTESEKLSTSEERSAIKKHVIFSAYEVGRIVDTSVEPIPPQLELKKVDALFNLPQTPEFLPVIEKQKIMGYIKKDKFKAKLGQNHFTRDIFLKAGNTAGLFTDKDVVVLDSYVNLSEASKILMDRDNDHLYDPFVITHEGKYLGVSSVKQVMDGISYYQKKDFQASQEAQQSIMTSHGEDKKYNVDFHAINEQLGMVGGDYVYHHWLNEHLSLFVLLDVCGKGLKASNMLMAIGSFIKHQLDIDKNFLKKASHKNFRLVQRVNRLNHLVAANTPSDMYATGVFLLLDTQDMILQYMNYGHPDVYLARHQKGTVLPIATDVPEGMFPFFGIEEDLYIKSQKIKIEKNDVLFTFSDGVNEARNNRKEEFTEERIQKLVKENQNLTPLEINAVVRQELEVFKHGYRTIDDTTMLCVKV